MNEQNEQHLEHGPVGEPAADASVTEVAPLEEHTSQPTAEPKVLYRWNYAEQRTREEQIGKSERKRGGMAYAIVMASAFLVCFLLLAGLLIWNEVGSRMGLGDGMTAVEVAEEIKPATVLIYATNAKGFSYGTGFFIRSDGYIATNYHVVEGYDALSVTLLDATVHEAKLIGYSANDDLAVLKIDGTNYPAARIGNSDALLVGETAIAIGHPSGANAAWTTTQGIISALNRQVEVEGEGSGAKRMTMIQTDAPVNPGNSGGPLCNDRGEVIGIVTRKASDYEGMGMAIPINGAMQILNAIIRDGNADDVDSSVSTVRPTVGITCRAVDKGDRLDNGDYARAAGIYVTEVSTSSGAYGVILEGDVITELNKIAIRTPDALSAQLYNYRVGDTVVFTVNRAGTVHSLEVVLK